MTCFYTEIIISDSIKTKDIDAYDYFICMKIINIIIIQKIKN